LVEFVRYEVQEIVYALYVHKYTIQHRILTDTSVNVTQNLLGTRDYGEHNICLYFDILKYIHFESILELTLQ